MKKKRDRKPKPRKEEAPTFRPLEAALRAKLSNEQAQAEKKQASRAEPQPIREAPSAPAQPIGQGSELSENDRELLRQFMMGTVPLGGGAGRIPRTASSLEKREWPKAPPGPDPDDVARAHLRALVEGTSTFEVVDDGARIEGRRTDVDPRTLRRLRHGVLPVDARLDLHGMALDEAKRAVEAFVTEKQRSHERVLLIIHGKGTHSLGGVGVLRGEIGSWLSEGPAARHVACFASARNEDGGTGAVYVLLRR